MPQILLFPETEILPQKSHRLLTAQALTEAEQNPELHPIEALIEWIETLKINQGALVGECMKVLPWQRKFLMNAIYGDCMIAALSVGRGNGKTALLATVAAATVCGPLHMPGSEVCLVSSSVRQAQLLFQDTLDFLGPAIEITGGRRTWTIENHQANFVIKYKVTGASVRVLPCKSSQLHGLRPRYVFFDEPAQFPMTTADATFNVMRTAMGKQEGSKMILLGTRSSDPQHFFSRMLKSDSPNVYVQCHAAGDNDPIHQRSTWLKANPSLQHMPVLEKAIQRESDDAKDDSSVMQGFRALRLNMGVSEKESIPLLEAAVYLRHVAPNVQRAGPCIWGIDLGATASLSAVTAYWPESGCLETLAAVPAEPNLIRRGEADGVGRLYQTCAEAGELITAGTHACDIPELFGNALERFGPPAIVAADRYKFNEIIDFLNKAGIPRTHISWRGQGWKDGGEDTRLFTRAFLSGLVKPKPSLLLAASFREARLVCDPAGNQKLARHAEGGKRVRGRDDPAAAAVLAIAESQRTACNTAPAVLMTAVI